MREEEFSVGKKGQAVQSPKGSMNVFNIFATCGGLNDGEKEKRLGGGMQRVDIPWLCAVMGACLAMTSKPLLRLCTCRA